MVFLSVGNHGGCPGYSRLAYLSQSCLLSNVLGLCVCLGVGDQEAAVAMIGTTAATAPARDPPIRGPTTGIQE
jgi:hypothetical protein